MTALHHPDAAIAGLPLLSAAPSTRAEREPLMAAAPPLTAPVEQQPSNTAPASPVEHRHQSRPEELSSTVSCSQRSTINTLLPRPRPEAEQVSQTDSADDSFKSGTGRREKGFGQPGSFNRSIARVNRLQKNTWAAEVVSCISAVVALAGLVTLLALCQDQPIPHWPQGISINTAVSVFTAVLKAGLVMPLSEGVSQLKYQWFRQTQPLIALEEFDSASRGPWGSFLFMIKPRKHYLATFGALLIVVAMAVDPFSQQILHFYDCSRPFPASVAAIPRSNNYTDAWIHSIVQESVLKAPMAVAIAVGTLAPPQNVSSLLSVQCESGNCTFPADAGVSYMTMSMCSSCTDISQSVIDNKSEGSSVLNWTLPAIPVPAGYSAKDHVEIGHGVDFMTQTAYLGTDNALLTFESLMFSCDGAANLNACLGGDTDTLKPFATRCSLFPCIRTYGANITNYVLGEKLLSSTPLAWVPGTQEAGYFALASNSTVQNGTHKGCNPSKQPTESNSIGLSKNYTLASLDGVHATYWTSADCFWYMDSMTAQAIFSYFDFLEGEQLLGAYGSILDALGDLFLVGLYHNATANLSTFSRYIDGLADAMSAEIRHSGAGNAALGEVTTNQTCIQVQWVWLSLPIALVVLTILFLAVMIWCSLTQESHSIWKSSSLALLFATVESETLVRDGVLDERSQMCKTAEEMQVRLEHTDRGWGFIEK